MAEHMESYLNTNGLSLGYVAKTTYKYREYGYEEAKSLDDYRLIGISRLILGNR